MLERWLKPRTENADPEIRKQAYAEVDPDDPNYKEAVGRDEDASVRASLLRRLRDLELLEQRCRDEKDATAAAVARERMRELLCGGADAPAVETRLARFVVLSDADTIEYVVRRGDDARVRDAALSRLLSLRPDCPDLLTDVASGDGDADLRSRAVDLLSDTEALDKVAVNVRKSDKDLHRRARNKIRAIRENEEKQHAREQLVADIEELAGRALEAQIDSLHRRQARLHHWREGWKRLELDEPQEPVAAALKSIEARINEVRKTVTARKSIIDEIASADGGQDGAEKGWREAWSVLEDHRDSDHEQLQRALDDYTVRKRSFAQLNSASAAATTLLGEWEGMDWKHTVVDDQRRAHLDGHWKRIALPEKADATLHQRYAALRDRLRDVQMRQQEDAKKSATEISALVEQLAAHLEAGRSAEATSAYDKINHRLTRKSGLPPDSADKIRKCLAELEPELRKLKEWRHWGADQAREQLCGEAEALSAQAESLKANKLASSVKALREKWQKIDKGVGAASARLWKRFDGACEAAYAPAKKAFDQQAQERRENADAKRAVCDRIEAFTRDTDWDAPDWQAATGLLDESRRKWREIGGVSHRQFEKLRERYRRVVAALDEKLDDERQREIRRRTLAISTLKKGLDNEPLGDLIESAKTIQRDWRPTVRSRRKEEQTLWEALREVCDAIFARRDERFATRREEESTSRKTRDALCAEVDELLCDAECDETVVNQATGRFDEIRREWRDAGPLAPKQKTALERRYREACKSFEARRNGLRMREKGRHKQAILERALLVDERHQRLSQEPSSDMSDLQAAWDALPVTRGAFGKVLATAFTAKGRDTADVAANLDAKLDTCLRLELLANVESPSEFQAQRMALKIALLSESLSGSSSGGGDAALDELLTRWYESAPVAASEWGALRKRFESAAQALINSC